MAALAIGPESVNGAQISSAVRSRSSDAIMPTSISAPVYTM